MSTSLSPANIDNTLSSTWSNKSKQNNMMDFIRGVQEYRKSRTDETANSINRHIQKLTVAMDTTIFDPNTSIVCEFFASMHELLTFPEARSSVIWSCISVLQTACKNQAARLKLIHTYQFIPILSGILCDHMSNEKRIKLLTLLQELSCGVKITWIIPNLELLITTLLRWVRNSQEHKQVKLLSLSIIGNICFRNPPCTYMLSKCVVIKEFSRFLLQLKDPKIEAVAGRLFIIIDYFRGDVSQETFENLLQVTFTSVKESFLAKDAILLRQNIEFYLNVNTDHNHLQKLMQEKTELIAEIIYMISHENKTPSGDCIAHDPECMSLVFKFLQSIIRCNLPDLNEHYLVMSKVALNWIQTESVAPDAINFLKTIIETSLEVPSSSNMAIFEMIVAAMPVLLVNLQNIESRKMHIAESTRLGSIMTLLQILCRFEKIRNRLMSHLAKEQFSKLFDLIIKGCDDVMDGNEVKRSKTESSFTREAIALYVNALCLISLIAKHHNDWQEFFVKIMEYKEIHAVIAEGLYTGNKEIRAAVLEITGNSSFPCKSVAESMIIYKSTPSTFLNTNQRPDVNTMAYSKYNSHSPDLDEIMKVLNEARAGQRINIATCDVMELYECRLATLARSEQAAMASVEAASSQCTHLQHQLASVESELLRIKQLFLHSERTQKDSQNTISILQGQLKYLGDEKKLRQKLEGEIVQLKTEIKQKDAQMVELVKKQEEMYAEKEAAMQKIIQQLQASLRKIEKLSQHKDDNIKSLGGELHVVKQQLNETTLALRGTEEELKERSTELRTALSEASERQELIDQIMKLAHTRK